MFKNALSVFIKILNCQLSLLFLVIGCNTTPNPPNNSIQLKKVIHFLEAGQWKQADSLLQILKNASPNLAGLDTANKYLYCGISILKIKDMYTKSNNIISANQIYSFTDSMRIDSLFSQSEVLISDCNNLVNVLKDNPNYSRGIDNFIDTLQIINEKMLLLKNGYHQKITKKNLLVDKYKNLYLNKFIGKWQHVESEPVSRLLGMTMGPKKWTKEYQINKDGSIIYKEHFINTLISKDMNSKMNKNEIKKGNYQIEITEEITFDESSISDMDNYELKIDWNYYQMIDKSIDMHLIAGRWEKDDNNMSSIKEDYDSYEELTFSFFNENQFIKMK